MKATRFRVARAAAFERGGCSPLCRPVRRSEEYATALFVTSGEPVRRGKQASWLVVQQCRLAKRSTTTAGHRPVDRYLSIHNDMVSGVVNRLME